ncbi:MAG: glycosyltransferase [Nitrospirae bacterium]|nr:glycosyltransferase [Nitrospirota bacterium]
MKLSIITAVFNNRRYIETCLQSLSSQSHPDIEHIIIDGGSTDGTLDVIARFTQAASRYPASNAKPSALCSLPARVTHVVSEPDNGIYDALNKGIRMATGEVIGFLHADDLYADASVIGKVASAMSQSRADSCYGDLVYVRYCGQACKPASPQACNQQSESPFRTVRYWKSGEFSPDLLGKGWMPPHPTFFARREVYERAGVFDTGFKIAADYELMLRFLGKHKITTCYIPEVLVRMRVGGASNKSLPNILRKSSEDLRAMKMHHIGGLPTLIRKNLSKLPQFFKK